MEDADDRRACGCPQLWRVQAGSSRMGSKRPAAIACSRPRDGVTPPPSMPDMTSGDPRRIGRWWALLRRRAALMVHQRDIFEGNKALPEHWRRRERVEAMGVPATAPSVTIRWPSGDGLSGLRRLDPSRGRSRDGSPTRFRPGQTATCLSGLAAVPRVPSQLKPLSRVVTGRAMCRSSCWH